MSKEYIERDEVFERIRRVYCLDCESMKRYGVACCDSCGIGDALFIIDDQPAADVVEVRHGVWIPYEDESWVCSECGTENCYAYNVNLGRFEDIYCPCCGVKMDGERSEK